MSWLHFKSVSRPVHSHVLHLCPYAVACIPGWPLYAAQWPSCHCTGRGPPGESWLCHGTPQLCYEQLVHQPGPCTDWAFHQGQRLQDWSVHASKEGNIICSILFVYASQPSQNQAVFNDSSLSCLVEMCDRSLSKAPTEFSCIRESCSAYPSQQITHS